MRLGKILVLLYPLAAVCFAWLVFLRTDDVLGYLALPVHKTLRVKDVLPPLPETRALSFEMGGLVQRLKDAQLAGAKDAVAAVLSEAQTALGAKRPVRAEDLLDLHQRLAEADVGMGIARRVRGFFSFVNVIWMLSILGVTISVGPALCFIVGPVISRILIRTLVPLWRNVVLPLLLRLKPLYELAAFLACGRLLVEGARYPPETGPFVSLTGAVLLGPAITYSAVLHSDGGGSYRDLANLINVAIAATLAPAAMLFSSHLLGFLAVVALYGALGFSVVPLGLCWCVGWRSEDGMSRTAAASVCLLAIAAGVKFGTTSLAAAASARLAPFAAGVQCMGTVTLFLALLILSSPHYKWGRLYRQGNAAMAACLVLGLFVGSVYALPAVFNVACTYLVLYVSEKVLELPVWRSAGGLWCLIFLGSGALYAAALWLHGHPGFIVSLFSPGSREEHPPVFSLSVRSSQSNAANYA